MIGLFKFMQRLTNRVNYQIRYAVTMLLKKYASDYFGELSVSTYRIFPKYLDRLRIASTAIVGNAFFNVGSGTIIIEDNVLFGSGVSVITGMHDYQRFGIDRQRSCLQNRDVLIKRGVFVGCNVTILGPCVIGEHSVIGACCLVYHDVQAYTVLYSNNSYNQKRISPVTDKVATENIK